MMCMASDRAGDQLKGHGPMMPSGHAAVSVGDTHARPGPRPGSFIYITSGEAERWRACRVLVALIYATAFAASISGAGALIGPGI